METVKLAKENVNETGIRGGEQREFEEGGCVDRGLRGSVEH